MHECTTRKAKPCARRRDKRGPLEAQLRALQLQLQRLAVQNDQLQYRQQVLSAVCDFTQKLLHILRINGPRLEGPLHSGLSPSTQSALLQLEGQVRCAMGDRPVLLEGPLESEQRLLPPSCRVSKLDDLMAPNTASGGCLAVAEFALSCIAANPEEYAIWSRAAPCSGEEYGTAMRNLAEDLPRMLVTRTSEPPQRIPSNSSSGNSSNSRGTSTAGSSAHPMGNPATGAVGGASSTPGDTPLQLLTPDTSCLAPGVTPLDLALRMLSHAADGIAVAVLQPGASFAAMRSAHLQQPSDDFWRARVRALQLTQAQINSIVAAMAVHKPLQEALLEEQEQLLAQVEALLQPHAQQQQQERQQDGTQAQDGVAEGCAQDGPALGDPQQQGKVGAASPTEAPPCQGGSSSATTLRGPDGQLLRPAEAAAAVAAVRADGVSDLNPLDHSQLRALCRRLEAASYKLSCISACSTAHVVGLLTVHQIAVFVINVRPYPTIFLPFAHWLAAAVARGEGKHLAVDAPPAAPSSAGALQQQTAAAAAGTYEAGAADGAARAAAGAAAAAARTKEEGDAAAAAAMAAGGVRQAGAAGAVASGCTRPKISSTEHQPEGFGGSRQRRQHMESPNRGFGSPAEATSTLQSREQQQQNPGGSNQLQQGPIAASCATSVIPSPSGGGMAAGYVAAQQRAAPQQAWGQGWPPLAFPPGPSQQWLLSHVLQQQQVHSLPPAAQLFQPSLPRPFLPSDPLAPQQQQQQQQQLYARLPALQLPRGPAQEVHASWGVPPPNQAPVQQQHGAGDMLDSWQQLATIVLPPESPTAAGAAAAAAWAGAAAGAAAAGAAAAAAAAPSAGMWGLGHTTAAVGSHLTCPPPPPPAVPVGQAIEGLGLEGDPDMLDEILSMLGADEDASVLLDDPHLSVTAAGPLPPVSAMHQGQGGPM